MYKSFLEKLKNRLRRNTLRRRFSVFIKFDAGGGNEMSGRVLRDSLPAAADRAGNWLTSSSGGPALCRLWRRSSLLCVGLRRLTHMGGRLHALLFEHPTALNPAVVDHDNAGKPVFKTDKFILMQIAPNQECHNGNLCDGA